MTADAAAGETTTTETGNSLDAVHGGGGHAVVVGRPYGDGGHRLSSAGRGRPDGGAGGSGVPGRPPAVLRATAGHSGGIRRSGCGRCGGTGGEATGRPDPEPGAAPGAEPGAESSAGAGASATPGRGGVTPSGGPSGGAGAGGTAAGGGSGSAEGEVKGYTVDGGRVTFSLGRDSAELVSATPNAGWRMQVWHHPQWIRVTFTQGERESDVFCSWHAHPPLVQTENR